MWLHRTISVPIDDCTGEAYLLKNIQHIADALDDRNVQTEFLEVHDDRKVKNILRNTGGRKKCHQS